MTNPPSPRPPTSQDSVKLRNGIFLAASRTYGESYVEPLIRKILGLKKVKGGECDAVDTDSFDRYEIKSAKVLLSKSSKNQQQTSLFDIITMQAELDPLSRIVSYENRKKVKYDANIQNVKRDHFDYLLYVLLFSEGIEIFKIPQNEINKQNVSSWSDKHGRYDALGKVVNLVLNMVLLKCARTVIFTSF